MQGYEDAGYVQFSTFAVFKIHNITEYSSIQYLVRPRRNEWIKTVNMSDEKNIYWQMCPKLLLYNLVDDQHLEKHVLLIQPRVKSKRSVNWMLNVDDTLLINIGMTPASSIFCTTF